MTRHDIEQAIARDLELCDLGMALTRGRLRRRYVKQRAACYAALHEMNVADGTADMSDDELLAALGVAPAGAEG